MDYSVPARPDVEWAFVGVLAATKSADLATTFVGLRWFSTVREANPIAVEAMAALGVPAALLALGFAVVVTVTAATESAAAAVAADATTPPWGPRVVRLTGYGVASTVHVCIAVRNASLLAAA